MSINEQLLEQQLSRVATRRKPKGVEMSRSTGIEYAAKLKRIVTGIRKDINEQLIPLLRKLAPQYQADSAPTVTRDNWSDVILAILQLIRDRWTGAQFDALAGEVASSFVRSADRVNADRFRKDLSLFGIDVFTDDPDLVNYLQLSIRDNTRLIKSISDQYLTQVESIVLTNVRAGGRPAVIQRQLINQFGVAERRAKLIARDQTAKVNGDLTRRRQTFAGFPYFQWITLKDERVRDRHDRLAQRVTAYGKGIYRWDDPPLSDRGEPIIPGEDFQCRCFARPVSQREVDENKKAGRVNPAVKR